MVNLRMKKETRTKFLKAAVSTAAGVVLLFATYLPVQAATPPPVVSLILGEEGATPWSISNIVPGQSGTKIVSLRNAGTSDGMITIWINDLVNTSISGVDPKYAGLSGDLADYLRINASSRGLETNVALPSTINNFPSASSGAYYVRVNPLRAGETINLTWNWELPSQTGNNMQGKGASFTLNYMLEELPAEQPPVDSGSANPAPATTQNTSVTPTPEPPPVTTPPTTPPATPVPGEPPVKPTPAPVAPPAPPTVAPPATPTPGIPPIIPPVLPVTSLSVVADNSSFTLKTDVSGIVQRAAQISDKAGNFVIDIAKGTRVTDQDGNILDGLILVATNQSIQNVATLPSGMAAVGPIYTIVGIRSGQQVSHVTFAPYVTITLTYDPKTLPANSLPPYVVNFVENGTIVKLDSPPGAIFESGKAEGIAYHASYFGLVADVLPEAPLPPHFRIAGINVNPGQATPGQTVTVNVEVANDGATAGTYEMHLTIDGVVRAVKDVNLDANSIATLTFEVADLAAGIHQVNVAGVTGQFSVIEAAVSIPGTLINWSLVDISVAVLLACGMLITYLVIARLRRSDRNAK